MQCVYAAKSGVNVKFELVGAIFRFAPESYTLRSLVSQGSGNPLAGLVPSSRVPGLRLETPVASVAPASQPRSRTRFFAPGPVLSPTSDKPVR